MDTNIGLHNIAVVGSRHFDATYYSILAFCIKFRMQDIHKHIGIVSGGAKGADTLAEMFANANLLPLTVFKPDWDKYGRSAGFRRNQDIVDASDEIIALWDGESRGTLDTMSKALQQNKTVFVLLICNNTVHWLELNNGRYIDFVSKRGYFITMQWRHFLVPGTGLFQSDVFEHKVSYYVIAEIEPNLANVKQIVMDSFNRLQSSPQQQQHDP